VTLPGDCRADAGIHATAQKHDRFARIGQKLFSLSQPCCVKNSS
jgi:hypothetical protein